MGLSEGQIIGSSLVIDNGPASKRFNLIIVSEGYQAGELGLFTSAVNDFISFMFSVAPFDSLRCAFNIYRIDVASTDSGADDPAPCGGTGLVKATMFDASFCNGGIRRLLCVDETSVLNVVQTYVPEWHQILVIVNSTVYGGSGGNITVTSTGGSWKKVAIHEMGHSAFGLADEYSYWSGCGIDVANNIYPGSEPVYPNVTTITDRNIIKWKDLVSSATPMPTTTNPDCSKCDTQPDPLTAGTTGTYEGGYYYHCGVFRPEYRCMMNDLSGFCAVCRKRIKNTLDPFLEKCYAPLFKPVPFIACILLRIVLVFVIFFLLIFSVFSDRLSCYLKKIRFIFRFCCEGNNNQCIPL